jgi:uncharacterized membrane protein YeaQ/YmgE (transglycosylase-associated protein family)
MVVALAAVALTPRISLAQDDQQPRVIVVPVPGEAPPDAGQPQVAPPPAPPPEPPPQPPPEIPPPPPTPPPSDRPIVAQPPPSDQPPPVVPVENPNAGNPDATAEPVSAMLDGHPREGSFLSGPGSFYFVMHHTLMGSLGGLAIFMVPNAIRATKPPHFDAFDGDARIAYLVGALVGAGVGFASSAAWQFYNWMNYTTATFGLINSIIGAMFLIGATNLFTQDATPISVMGLVGALGGAWLTAVIGGGDMAVNKGVLITSGAAWAAIYTALILGIVASTGSNPDLRAGIDALLFMPAVGAAALAVATLKFNPSTAQIVRADIFGGGVGLAVLLLSALLVPHQFNSPIPYVLSGLTAAGAKLIVSILWVDTVAAPPPETPAGANGGPKSLNLSVLYRDPENHKPYSRVWW